MYSVIHKLLEIMKENLGLLKDEMKHSDGSRLELFVVIVSMLIFIGVLSVFLINIL